MTYRHTFGADNRTCRERSERNSKQTSLLDLRRVSCTSAGCKQSLPTMRIALSQVRCQSKEKKNEPQRFVFLGFGAQKATAVEHINQNSFLLITFARTVIASSYDISSYNKIDVFSL